MRLTCPNCSAQYEVPVEAIPPAGRDVQCSACQHTWFEPGPPPEPLRDEELWDKVPRGENDDEESDDMAEVATAPPPVTPRPARPSVTPEVADILRAEAEREAGVRAKEVAPRPVAVAAVSPAITDRPTAPTAVETPRRPVVRAPEPVESPDPRPDPLRRPVRTATSRRPDRSLDIDQINSTLRSTSDRIGGKAPQIGKAPRRRRGFGGGFAGALLAMAVLALLYVFSSQIIAAVPGTEPVLTSYVNVVNAGRVWLDQQIGQFLAGDAGTAPPSE